MQAHLEVNPFRTWYYCISPNSRNLMILLKVDPTFGDELEIVCGGCYKIEDIFIFTWSLISGVGHYRWLLSPIC